MRSSYDEGRTWETWERGKVFYWGPTAYSDMVRLDGDEVGLMYEAGVANPYETHPVRPVQRGVPGDAQRDPAGYPGATGARTDARRTVQACTATTRTSAAAPS